YFMDEETFDSVPPNKELVEDALSFIKEGDTCDLAFYKGSAFSCEPQNFVELEVIEAEPGIPGATAQPGSKSATLETGFKIQVPLFVNVGDIVRVDTRDGTYMSRI
ncbi:MAG: elongation factor P, partial [Clostridiales bacterium]|nr:elongation factor P [Clostridiales bacterium]